MGFYYAQHHSRLSEQKGTQRTKTLCPKEFTFSDKKRNNILHFTCSSAEDQNSREKKKKKRQKRKHGAFRGRTGLLNVVVRTSFPEMICKPRPGKSENKLHECDYLGKIIPSTGNSKYKALEGKSAWQGAHITGVL